MYECFIFYYIFFLHLAGGNHSNKLLIPSNIMIKKYSGYHVHSGEVLQLIYRLKSCEFLKTTKIWWHLQW